MGEAHYICRCHVVNTLRYRVLLRCRLSVRRLQECFRLLDKTYQQPMYHATAGSRYLVYICCHHNTNRLHVCASSNSNAEGLTTGVEGEIHCRLHPYPWRNVSQPAPPSVRF